MIEEIVKNRLNLTGLTQAKLAEMSNCTATQMGIFLKGSGFLSKSSLEKCMSVLGIRLDIYDKRYKLALQAASKLHGYTPEQIVDMSKNEMVLCTGLSDITCLFDVTEKEFDTIVNSGIVDYEATYPYFKAMVLHLMQVGEKPSPKTVERSFSKLATALAIAPLIPVIGVSSIIGLATGMLFVNGIYSKLPSNALSPLMVLTKKILKAK